MRLTGALLICALILAFTSCRPGRNAVGQQEVAVSTATGGGEETPDAEQGFTSQPIPDDVWQRMQGLSWKDNDDISREDLRYLRMLHKDAEGNVHNGEMVCNKAIAEDLLEIFKALYEASYPIERMVLPDEYGAEDEVQMRANNTSCFLYRRISGSAKLSRHALGMAVDINPLYNPYVKQRKDGTLFIQPETAAPYCDRSAEFPYKIVEGDLACRLFAAHGFEWGGAWTSLKDYQHFER